MATAYPIVAFAAVVTLVATVRGPALSVDSASYLSAGLNLAAGRGLITFNATTLTMFPPGLPAVIAFGDWIGLSPAMTVRILNATAFAATVWLGFALLRRHVRSRTVIAVASGGNVDPETFAQALRRFG